MRCARFLFIISFVIKLISRLQCFNQLYPTITLSSAISIIFIFKLLSISSIFIFKISILQRMLLLSSYLACLLASLTIISISFLYIEILCCFTYFSKIYIQSASKLIKALAFNLLTRILIIILVLTLRDLIAARQLYNLPLGQQPCFLREIAQIRVLVVLGSSLSLIYRSSVLCSCLKRMLSIRVCCILLKGSSLVSSS